MVFTHDTEASLLAAVALVNSGEEPDTLTSADDLVAFLDDHEFTGTRLGDAAELARSATCGRGCATLLTSDRDTAAGLVNDLLAEEQRAPPAGPARRATTGTSTPSPPTRRWPPGSRSRPRWR